MRNEQWRILANVVFLYLMMRTANYALGLDKKSNNSARMKGASISIENESAIKREPIKVIGIVPDQNPKSNTSVLKGRSLRLQQSDTLGQTLEKELGVSNASFGPGVGVFVIRDLTGGFWVYILQNGIGCQRQLNLDPLNYLKRQLKIAPPLTISDLSRGLFITGYGDFCFAAGLSKTSRNR
ncbi:MAG: hypothetical protein ABTQ25_11910 [Nitrosomonas ureae]